MDDNNAIQKVEQFYLGGREWTPDDFLGGVDTVIELIKENGDFSVGADALRSMLALNKISGITLARMTYELKKVWTEFSQLEDDFYSYMSEFSGVKQLTLQRYHDAWVGIECAPVEVRPKLLAHPMKNLYALGSKIEQGYEPEEDEWVELANTRNNSEFSAVLRGMANVKPRKNSLTIYLEEDGSLIAWNNKGKYNVGYLMIDNKDEAVVKAIERIVRSTGIVKR